MTVQEAYKTCFGKPYIVPIEVHNEAKEVIIQALEEVEQYRALGTVEELKEAREKQVAKKPIRKHINTIRDSYVCPTCRTEWLFGKAPKYCGICGQKLGEEGGTSE